MQCGGALGVDGALLRWQYHKNWKRWRKPSSSCRNPANKRTMITQRFGNPLRCTPKSRTPSLLLSTGVWSGTHPAANEYLLSLLIGNKRE